MGTPIRIPWAPRGPAYSYDSDIRKVARIKKILGGQGGAKDAKGGDPADPRSWERVK